MKCVSKHQFMCMVPLQGDLLELGRGVAERVIVAWGQTEELSNLRTLSKKLLPLGVQTEITKMLLNLKNPAVADAPQMSKTVGLSSMPKMPTVAPTPSTSGRTTAEPPRTSRGAKSSQSSKDLSTPMIDPPKTDVNEPGEDQVKRRQKEISERKSFLRNFWYAAGKRRKLSGSG